MKGSSLPPPLSPLLLLFTIADASFLSHLPRKSSLLRLLRHLLLSSFLFLLRLFPSATNYTYRKTPKSETYSASVHGGGAAGGSAIGRALSQLLSIMNGVPVSSRKYEIVRSLAERIIEDNLLEGSEVLREVNRTVLSSAFDQTLTQLESAVLDRCRDPNRTGTTDDTGSRVSRVMRAVQYCSDVAWGRLGETGSGGSGEKLAAEALWLGGKMADCGCVEAAVGKWAAAGQLAWLGLSAEPQLQCSLVKVSAFFIKHTKNLGQEDEQESKKEEHKQTSTRMLMSWLPLLCRASNGTDTPVMSLSEKAELERILENIIMEVLDEEEQEKVLSLWLHHFTCSLSSDWPNLHACYSRWCAASRKRLLFQ